MLVNSKKSLFHTGSKKKKRKSGVNTAKTVEEKHSLHNHSSGEPELAVITGHTLRKMEMPCLVGLKLNILKTALFFEQNCYAQCWVRQEHHVQFGTQFETYSLFHCGWIGDSWEMTSIYPHFLRSWPVRKSLINGTCWILSREYLGEHVCKRT